MGPGSGAQQGTLFGVSEPGMNRVCRSRIPAPATLPLRNGRPVVDYSSLARPAHRRGERGQPTAHPGLRSPRLGDPRARGYPRSNRAFRARVLGGTRTIRRIEPDLLGSSLGPRAGDDAGAGALVAQDHTAVAYRWTLTASAPRLETSRVCITNRHSTPWRTPYCTP